MGTMNGQTSVQTAPQQNTNSEIYDRYYGVYCRRQNALNLIRQFNRTIKTAQRHRGMSMGMLGGNEFFREDFNQLQAQLERRILLLQAMAKSSEGLLSERDQDNLQNAWVTISRDWQEDSVIDNYELHCHMIEQSLAMLAALSRQLEQPIHEMLGEKPPEPEVGNYPSRFKHLEVLHFTTRLLPAVVEQIGRIRALGTYAAAAGYLDSHHDSKLRYVIQCTRVNNEKLRHQIKRLEGILDQDIGLLSQLKSYELKLMFLLNMVETDILHEGALNADSNRIYNLATDIIDVYLSIVDNGIDLISQWHDADMDQWLVSGIAPV
ncbi:hypothetical protein [Gilvimarinus sp. DA14]|uniref:hypothetical protein n=1 Tax=Gilvimarinus sp. DA14 TaxID=2956798 RepID=UPI0020B75E7F|nr:hypothetical protein [Gilvimarinus sp. DA14]UTF60013.1 hypothetical protein NHM04_16305 [Gilvimarinus sp. DA14]